MIKWNVGVPAGGTQVEQVELNIQHILISTSVTYYKGMHNFFVRLEDVAHFISICVSLTPASNSGKIQIWSPILISLMENFDYT